jgi:hypothetical protein
MLVNCLEEDGHDAICCINVIKLIVIRKTREREGKDQQGERKRRGGTD